MNSGVKNSKSTILLPYLPIKGKLRDNRIVSLDVYRKTDEEDVHSILKQIVNEGNTHALEDVSSVEDFKDYYCSHDVYVCRDVASGEILGSVYVKPNFPGRCSHICNGGFAVKPECRGLGVGTFLAKHYLQIARDLGYLGSMFNLVFETNVPSVNLWRKMGFKEIGRIPKAGYLKQHGYTDALQFYYDLTTIQKQVNS